MTRYLAIAAALALSACARGAAYNAGYAAEGYIGASEPLALYSQLYRPMPSFDLTNALLQQRLLTMPYPSPGNLFAR